MVDSGGTPAADLSPADFTVTDNGVTQKVLSATPAAHLTIMAVLDASESIPARRFQQLIRSLQALIALLAPTDRLGLLVAEDHLRLVRRPDTNAAAMDPVLAKLQPVPTARSPLWDAMLTAAALAADDSSLPVVMCLCDGGDTASWTRPRVALDLFSSTGVIVDGIQIQPGSSGMDIHYGPLFWDDLARATRGATLASAAGDLSARLESRLRMLRANYAVTFVPTGVKTGDGLHTLKVRVARPNVTAHAQAGYFSKR